MIPERPILIPDHRILIPTTKIIRGIDIAKAASQHSDASSDGKRMGSALFAGSRLVSIGFNMYSKSRPINVFRKDGRTFYKSVHAEQSAILKYNRHHTNHNSNSKLTLFVVRYTSLGLKACSKPCYMCQKIMLDFGIDTVVYFDLDGFIELAKIRS